MKIYSWQDSRWVQLSKLNRLSLWDRQAGLIMELPSCTKSATEAGSEVIEDDSDAETLRLNEGEDRSEYPDNTDNDPYEDAEHPEGSEPDAENPEGSQADVGTDPDITYIDIDESPDEAQEPVVPEQPSQSEETPKAATEAAVEAPPESIESQRKEIRSE